MTTKQSSGHSPVLESHRVRRVLALATVAALSVCGASAAGAGGKHEHKGGTTSLVTVASDGSQGSRGGNYPSISATGRFVAFDSLSDDLVPGDTNSATDIFVHDRRTGQTRRVSVASDGSQSAANGPTPTSDFAQISANGRFVVFQSEADNLAPGDTNRRRDIFVHELRTSQTSRVSVASDGSEALGISRDGVISASGRFVAFRSDADNLVADDTNGQADVFVHDLKTRRTSRVSIATDGSEADRGSDLAAISPSGRFVAFSSSATNLVADDTNTELDVFVRDLKTGRTRRASVASDGSQGNGLSISRGISTGGRFVLFESRADNLVPNDSNGKIDLFVHDLRTRRTTRVDVASDGNQASVSEPKLSANGRFITFHADADNLVSGDTNGLRDVFIYDRRQRRTSLVSVATDGGPGDGGSLRSAISANGRHVAFLSSASNLVTEDTNGTGDVFVRDLR